MKGEISFSTLERESLRAVDQFQLTRAWQRRYKENLRSCEVARGDARAGRGGSVSMTRFHDGRRNGKPLFSFPNFFEFRAGRVAPLSGFETPRARGFQITRNSDGFDPKRGRNAHSTIGWSYDLETSVR